MSVVEIAYKEHGTIRVKPNKFCDFKSPSRPKKKRQDMGDWSQFPLRQLLLTQSDLIKLHHYFWLWTNSSNPISEYVLIYWKEIGYAFYIANRNYLHVLIYASIDFRCLPSNLGIPVATIIVRKIHILDGRWS